ncbi:unnamed protein product, partial [Musa acuminata subsp. burmannicoides]
RLPRAQDRAPEALPEESRTGHRQRDGEGVEGPPHYRQAHRPEPAGQGHHRHLVMKALKEPQEDQEHQAQRRHRQEDPRHLRLRRLHRRREGPQGSPDRDLRQRRGGAARVTPV